MTPIYPSLSRYNLATQLYFSLSVGWFHYLKDFCRFFCLLSKYLQSKNTEEQRFVSTFWQKKGNFTPYFTFFILALIKMLIFQMFYLCSSSQKHLTTLGFQMTCLCKAFIVNITSMCLLLFMEIFNMTFHSILTTKVFDILGT